MQFTLLETTPETVLTCKSVAVRLSCAALYTWHRKSSPFGVHFEIGSFECGIAFFHRADKVFCPPGGELQVLVHQSRYDPLNIAHAIQNQHQEVFESLMGQAVKAEQEHQRRNKRPEDPEMERLFEQAFGQPTSHFQHFTGGFDPVKFSSLMGLFQDTSVADFISQQAGPQVAAYQVSGKRQTEVLVRDPQRHGNTVAGSRFGVQ